MHISKKILKLVLGIGFAATFFGGVRYFNGENGESLGSKAFDLPFIPGMPEATSSPTHRKSTWPSTGLSDAMLVDSILTIIQNYYVDVARVDNQVLIKGTLQTLNEQGLIQLSFIDEENWQAKKGSESLSFQISSSYNYDEMMRDALRLTKFLDRHKTRQEAAEKTTRSGAFLLLNSMLASLDPHSNLLGPEEYRDLRQGTEGSFGGLGVVVGMQDDVLTVIKPLPKSPADRAGVSKLDRIMQIDSKSTFGTTLDDLIQYMRGEPGTKVNLFILREGDNAPRKLSLTREIIQVDSVVSRTIESEKGPIFYASIDSFSSRTAAELRDSMLKAQQKNPNMTGIVLDLRSNPGGLLDQAVKVADLFLDEGRIVSTQGRTREYEIAKQNLYHFDYPIVILTNGDTASASEIVAGALRDHGRALVIGEPSFGKGSVQTVFELPGEQALKLTIARYFTPRGTSIQNTGIMPDIWLQPVYAAKDNVNILGEYRYKSERFLDHSLDQNKLRSANNLLEWKAYYLEDVAERAKSKPKDTPLVFATRILEDLAAKNDVPFPVERLRSSYWKASSTKLIRKMLKDLNHSSEEWLSSEKKVDWRENEARIQIAADKDLKFRIDVSDRQRLREGQAMQVPWHLKNTGKMPIGRISLFITGNNNAVSTHEILVGSVEPGQELSGVINYDLKINAKEGPLRLRAGVARSGWPMMGKDQNFWVDISENQEPQYSYSLSLNHEKGGRVSGVLEAGEDAEIELVVKNTSAVTAKQLDIRLVNLAGKQIQIDDKHVRFKQLLPGESRAFKFNIRASFDLASTQIQVGALVASQEQLLASKGQFVIVSEPGTRMSKTDTSTGSEVWKEN